MFELGNSLREARLQRKLDLLDAEHDTKIRSRYLAALEEEDFAVLPGSVFARGFLRTYAKYLGLDWQAYVDEYNERFGRFEEIDDPIVPSRRLEAGRDAHRSSQTPRIIALAAILACALFAWIALKEGRSAERTRNSLHAQSTATVHPQTTSPVESIPSGTAGIEGLSTPAASQATRTASTASLVVRLVIAARKGSSWIQVQQQSTSGHIVWAGTLAQGTRRTFTGRRLIVSVGYPGAVTLQVPGRRLAGTGAQAARFLVTPTRIRPV